MKRLFFALWPDPITRQQCADVIAEIDPADAKPVPAINLHTTLLFLGQLDTERQIDVTQDAGKLTIEPISLTFDQLSYWKKPAVLCLTSSQIDQHCLRLNQQLGAIARKHLIPIDDRPFTPHVTLCKKAHTPVQLKFKPVQWQSRDFCLVESLPTAHGVKYQVLKRWSLTI